MNKMMICVNISDLVKYCRKMDQKDFFSLPKSCCKIFLLKLVKIINTITLSLPHNYTDF